MDDERQNLINGLREFASWLEAHPDAPMPSGTQFDAFVHSPEELAEAARMLGRADKKALSDWFYLERMFGPIHYNVNIPRAQVCTRKVVGSRVVPEHTEEVVEWECSDSILEPQ